MRAVYIDPYDETVSEVDYNGDFKEIYNLIDCSTFENRWTYHRRKRFNTITQR